MEERNIINSQYYCGRSRPGGTILVSTTGAYVVAEYDERTGGVMWQRQVQANQKIVIQNWLNQHFPPKKDPPKPAAQPAKATRR